MGDLLKLPCRTIWQLFMAGQGKNSPELASAIFSSATAAELVCQQVVLAVPGVAQSVALKDIRATMWHGIVLFFADGEQIIVGSNQWARWDESLRCWLLRFPISAVAAKRLAKERVCWLFNYHDQSRKRLAITVATPAVQGGFTQRLLGLFGWATKKAG